MTAGAWTHLPLRGPPSEPDVTFGPVRVWRPLVRSSEPVIIEPIGADPIPEDPRLPVRWRELCASNPRLHDGPIWAVRAFEPAAGVIHVAADDYSRYAVRPRIGAGTWMLAVRGVITARDASGEEYVLLGLRSPSVRNYGDMWEVIPGGGVPRPDHHGSTPSISDLIDHLRQEAREEAGLEVPPPSCRVAGVCDDSYAGGFDVLIEVRIADPLAQVVARMGERDWEHRRVEWKPVREIATFDAREGSIVSPPTRAIFRYLGWVDRGPVAGSGDDPGMSVG